MFLLDKNIFLTKEMHRVKSKLHLNVSHAPSTQTVMFISLVTSMVWGIGPKEWDPIMTVINVWIPEQDASSPAKSVSKCSNKALHQGSNYSFKLLRYLCSCYEWGPQACNNYKCNSKSVNLLYTFGRTSSKREWSITRHTEKRRHIPMQPGAFKPTITAFQQHKTVHNLCPQWLPDICL